LAIVFDLAARRGQIAKLENRTKEPDFWSDPASAQELMRKLSALRGTVEPWEELSQRLEDYQVLLELAAEEDDESVAQEVAEGLEAAGEQIEELELAAMLGGKYDAENAILTITAGAGGTEACDWAEMLVRMYRLWSDARGFEFQVISFVEGDAAGFRNVTARVAGSWAFGYLRAESGVHRLVRISPFDSSKRRHTSFASVDVIPEVEEDLEVDINPEELRVETFRSGGAGGQHVNKTDSAVRITHEPTGTTAQSQAERSQHANRRFAMQVLRARLAEHQRQQRSEEMDQIRGSKQDIAFASQIRSYVMQPYTMVKDHRTNVEVSQVEAVLDGEIDGFIRAYLLTAAGEGGEM